MNLKGNRIALMALLIASLAFAQVQITNTNVYYTAEQMLLANEINESGEPFAEALVYNLDNLDPAILNVPDSISYTMGIESYEYSRYQLGTIISRSGMGLHMMWAPVISEMAAMEPDSFDGTFTGGMINGFKEDDILMKTIMHFAMLTNHTAPGNPWPQFAEFVSGDPHLPQAIDADNFSWADFSTLRWDRSMMDKTLNPAALGQALMKQYLWAQDMLGGFHDADDNGIDPDGNFSPDSVDSPNFDPANNVYYGGNGLDGFIGMVLTAEAINKVKFIVTNLAYDGTNLGMLDPATYDPANGIKYFPHAVAVTEMSMGTMLPPKANGFTVTDATSNLFDQVSLLWGTINFKNMMDPDNSRDAAHLAYHSVFDGNPFPAPMSVTGMPGPFDLMKGTSKVLFQNLLALHFDGTAGTFVDESGLTNGLAQPGNVITTVNAGYLLVILKQVAEEFAGTPLESMALNALNNQAGFLLANLQETDGFANSYIIGSGTDNNAKLAVSQAAAARGLYAAYEATGNSNYLNGADAAYMVLLNDFYDPNYQAFRTESGNTVATYTPFNFAVITGALREGSLVGGHADAPAIYTRFFKQVANVMQLSEGEATGETGLDSDGDGIPFIPEQADQLPPVFASEAILEFAFVGVEDDQTLVPGLFSLAQNYPNPFNPSTTIAFQIASPGRYSLNIYDVTGRMVSTLFNKTLENKAYELNFDASQLSTGVYYPKFRH
ncbi:MAG: T9SS type A sorting domain-containing protein [Candidatus Marinimicrobia bacterium]|nr:T9SS type A sorting domain-containing protein [Candidatus Neomarinimicrobiota bacterium]